MLAWPRLASLAVQHLFLEGAVATCRRARTTTTLCQQAVVSELQQRKEERAAVSDASRVGDGGPGSLGSPWTDEVVHSELHDHTKVSMLMALFRQRSHLVAKLDPLGRAHRTDHAESLPIRFGKSHSRWCDLCPCFCLMLPEWRLFPMQMELPIALGALI